MTTLRVEQVRGERFEASHPVSAVLADAVGDPIDAVGEDLATTWRSAAKPFQLETSLGFVDGGGLDPRDLAIGAASHSGEPGHVARVRGLLDRFGLSEGHLRCGAHAPVFGPAADALVRAGIDPAAIHNNCSGKHAFMAAAARARGWDPDYRDAAHPLQANIRDRIADRCGVVPDAVVDGCGVPCWVVPLSAMARAWATLGVAMGGEGVLGRIGRAMAAHPWETAGTGRPEVVLMESAGGRLVCKVGAEGLMCGALPERGLGFAIKVHSGNAEARAVATWALLARWAPGLVAEAGAEPWRGVRNVVGREVGVRRVVWGGAPG